MVTPYYYEKIDSISPSSAGFSFEGGRAVFFYFVNANEVEDSLIDLLGDVSPGADGRLVRTLPKAHPQYPWLFAERISEIRGIGNPVKVDAEQELEAETLPAFAEYDRYLLTVEFTSRPYAVLSDASIVSKESTYFDESNTVIPYKYANEWDRFVDWDYQPSPELITAQQGQFKFRTTGASPNNVTFPGRPRITVPSATVFYRWFQVPYSYLSSANSYLDRYIGYVNQVDWDGWPAGTLLYDGVRVLRRYTPVVPALTQESFESAYSIEKFADLELVFRYTSRTGTIVPTPSNGNWVAAGHNLQPWFGDRKFYYVSADASTQYAMFLSFPFSLFFTNPDS